MSNITGFLKQYIRYLGFTFSIGTFQAEEFKTKPGSPSSDWAESAYKLGASAISIPSGPYLNFYLSFIDSI